MACIEIEYAEMFARVFPGFLPGRLSGKPGDRERPKRPGEPGIDLDRDWMTTAMNQTF
jgi:hypothetical protein